MHELFAFNVSSHVSNSSLSLSFPFILQVKRRYAIDASNRSTRVSRSSKVQQQKSLPADEVPEEEEEDEEAGNINSDPDSSSENLESLLPLLAGPVVPDPVFFCSIEPPSAGKQKDMEEALIQLQREDPSLKVKSDENGQMTVSGMGELHIEILKDRLMKEYGIHAYLGPLQVAYRESIDDIEVREFADVSKIIGGKKNSCNMIIVLKPVDDIMTSKKKSLLKVIIDDENNLYKLRREHRKAIENGIEAAFACGPLLNFPVVGVQIELHWFEASYDTTPAFISSTTSSAVTSALKKANVTLLEPLMRLEITAPISHSNKIISDLSSRRSQLGEVSERNDVRYIESVTPLSELVNYSSVLRSLSSGTATLSMHFLTYKRMTESEKRVAKERVTGFS